MSYKKVEKKFQKDLVLREDVLIIKYKKKIIDMKKVPTVTPEGALKKMNFNPKPSTVGGASRIEVDGVLSKVPGRYRAVSSMPPKYPSIIMRGGIPHKIVDGKWVSLIKVAK
jgi:hypothetical protein